MSGFRATDITYGELAIAVVCSVIGILCLELADYLFTSALDRLRMEKQFPVDLFGLSVVPMIVGITALLFSIFFVLYLLSRDLVKGKRTSNLISERRHWWRS